MDEVYLLLLIIMLSSHSPLIGGRLDLNSRMLAEIQWKAEWQRYSVSLWQMWLLHFVLLRQSVRSGPSDHSRLPSLSSSSLKVGEMKPETKDANVALWHHLSGQILLPTSCEYLWQQLTVALGPRMENPNQVNHNPRMIFILVSSNVLLFLRGS